jgi:predicted  nucleic acid-binding Zn-ribbon protein
MTSATELLGLQEIDLLRDKNRAQLADIEARLAETEELIAAREAVAAAEAELQGRRGQQKDIETRLADLDAKIRPIEKRLYDGSVRNPKELTDLQREVDSLKANRSALEDEGLEYVDAVEAADQSLAAARQALRAVEAQWQADQEGLRSSRARIERETAQLDAERSRLATGMAAVALAEYEKLRGARQGRAVARIERGSCQGCRVSLPTHVIQRAHSAANLVQCPRCERILVP